MSTITEKTETHIIFYPYGETKRYKIDFGRSTGPMTEPGISICREDNNHRFCGGCIPVEDIDVIISMLCKFRNYNDPTGLTKLEKEVYPETVIPYNL